MLHKNKLKLSIKALLIICSFIELTYYEYTLDDTTSTLSTIQRFWHENHDDCKFNTSVLIKMFKQLMDITCTDEDQFLVLLTHSIRKHLILMMSQQLEAAIKEKTLGTNKILEKNMNKLQEIDKRAVKSIWALTIDRVDIEVVIEEIVLLKDEELQIEAFQKLIDKCLLDTTKTSNLMSLLTFHIVKRFKNRISCSSENSLDRLYCHLPQELLLLYEDLKQPYILTNHVRLPKGKQTICTLVTFEDKAFVAFGIKLGGSVEYIYGDDSKRVYFMKSSNFKSNQLWQVIWPFNNYRHDASGYIMFQNKMTKKLLCLEDLKLVQLSATENMQKPECYWRISYATETEISEEC
ncbi:uncharacterized protein LOC124420406 [Lucilia cuprina]|uniref:uncharacterized protein LOC124420406 n=1 Tax=Lucilia cuprina TaxID=7375 RepID=UPI001F05D257|nr:uncharacterized protein LOC124420406 [Lucilia cuprina]